MGAAPSSLTACASLRSPEGMGPLEPEDAGTVRDVTSEQRLAPIFDVQTQAATRFGATGNKGWTRTSWTSSPRNGLSRGRGRETPEDPRRKRGREFAWKSDLAFWLSMNDPAFGGFGVPYGPGGFIPGWAGDIDRAEAGAPRASGAREKVQPVEQEFNDHLKASVSGLGSGSP